MVEISNQAGGAGEQQQTSFRKSLQALLPYQLTGKRNKKPGYDTRFIPWAVVKYTTAIRASRNGWRTIAVLSLTGLAV